MKWNSDGETSFVVSEDQDQVDIMLMDLVMDEATHEVDIHHIEDMDLVEVTIIQDTMEMITEEVHLVPMVLHQ